MAAVVAVPLARARVATMGQGGDSVVLDARHHEDRSVARPCFSGVSRTGA